MTKIRLLPILIFVLTTTSLLQAQQLSLFTQYRENATIINPAAIESDFFAFGQNLTFGVSYRSQWTGISNNPTTQTLRGSYIHKNGSGVAIQAGGYLLNDQTGPTGFTGLYGRIGGVVSSDPEYNGLSIALSGGLVQYRLDADKLVLRDPNDISAMGSQTQLFPDVGLGIYFYQSVGSYGTNYFYVGASVPQIIGLDLTFQDENGDFFVTRVQHMYGMLGLYKFFDNDSFLEPSMWVKYVPGATPNVDFNIRYQLPSVLWVGTGISTAGTFHFETGFLLGDPNYSNNAIRLGYGFDYSFTPFGPYVGSTHEINLSFSIDR